MYTMKNTRFNLLSLLLSFTFLFVSINVFSQEMVSGNVSDAEGNPLPGVSIVEMNTTNGVVSDFDGNFQLSVDSNAVLVFSYLGFLSQEVSNLSSSMSVTLQEDVSKLEEVVVVGYGSQTKKTLTGAVATVNSEALTLKPAQNTSELLMGQVAGLSTRQSGALPGADFATLRIRNFEAPLIIVDGIVATFGQVDPNDIESISVLKDGAASIYGARAGNGVILVTTKRGTDRGEGAKFAYHGTSTWSSPTVTPNTLGVHDYGVLLEENGLGFENEAPGYLSWDASRKRVYNNLTGEDFAGFDWYETAYRDWTPQKQHNISARGRSKGIGYFISVGFTDTESTFRDADYTHERYNIRTNLDVNFTDNLSAKVDMAYYQTTIDRANFPLVEMYNRLTTGKPTHRPIYPDPSYPSHAGSATPYSPIYMLRKDTAGTIVERDNNLRGAVSLTYDVPFIPGLEATASLNMESQNEWNKNIVKQFMMYTYDPSVGDGDAAYIPFGTYRRDNISVNSDRDMELLPKLTLTYEKEFENSELKALFVAESTSFKRDYMMASRTDPLSFEAPYLNYSSEAEKDNAEIFSESARSSYVTRVNYSLKDKYLFEAIVRADATARYSVDGRWGVFPALSFGWRISEEDFMKDNTSWNNLKLRLSHGIMGNDAVSNFDFLTGYNIANGFYLFGGNPYPIISSAGLANALVTWETMAISNIGLDGTLWDGALGFELDIFYRLREDMLALPDSDIPFHFGASLPQTNLNSKDNRGFDLMLKHKGKIGSKITYEFNPMISYSRGKFVKWEENILPTTGVDEATLQANRDYNYRYTNTGQWDDRQWGYTTNGFFTTQAEIDAHPIDQDTAGNSTLIVGDLIYTDQNGDGIIDWRDQTPIGKGGMPKWNFSAWTSAKWGNWSIDALWQGASGYSINFSGSGSWQGLNSHQAIPKQFVFDNRSLVDANGDISVLRAFPPTNNTGGSTTNNNFGNDFARLSTTYLRLKTLNVSFNVPKSLTNRLGIDNAQIYVGGSNLITFDNLGLFSGQHDPEITGANDRDYPNVKTVTTGLRIGF
jgi:TonB-linked SusC/RagA family outer membrane protein